MGNNIVDINYTQFLEDIKKRVSASRYKTALNINRELILLYHHIGSEINKSQKQHGWGAKIIKKLSHDLQSEFPEMKGFSPQNLKYMRRFAEEYSLDEIGQQAVDQLPWGHNIVLMYEVSNKKERSFYIGETLGKGKYPPVGCVLSIL